MRFELDDEGFGVLDDVRDVRLAYDLLQQMIGEDRCRSGEPVSGGNDRTTAEARCLVHLDEEIDRRDRMFSLRSLCE